MLTRPTFTVDWEPYFCYKPYSQFWEETDPLVEEPTLYLLDLLKRHEIKAIWFCVGWLVDKRPDLVAEIRGNSHIIGTHTYYHSLGQAGLKQKYQVDINHPLFRSPKFKGQKRLYSGGFWFRLFPYWISKKLLDQSGAFYIHPYDVMLESPVKSFKRTVGLKTARDKLERLCREVEFESVQWKTQIH